MEENELRTVINSNIKEICHYSQMQVFATSYYQKNYFQLQIDDRITALMDAVYSYRYKSGEEVTVHAAQEPIGGQRIFTADELSYYDGSGGKPAYVAVNGNVYDMSLIPGWGGGTHFGLYAGRDYTRVFAGCHQGSVDLLNSIPRIGIMKE